MGLDHGKPGFASVVGRWAARALLLALATLCGGVGAAAASEIEVVVQIRGRGPLRDHPVVLGAPVGEEAPFRRFARPLRRAVTDDVGRALFLDLEPGTYQVNLYNLERFGVVSPHDNPQAPPPVVTLETGESRRVRLEVWPGVPVRVAMTVEGGEVAGTATFRHRDSGEVRTLHLSERRHEVERLLPAGVWEVLVSAPSGYLLSSVVHDGYPLAGHRVTLDLNDQPFATRLDFAYRIEAWVEGTVTLTEPGPLGAIEAALLVPGEWAAAASERGGSEVRRVVRSPDPVERFYRLPLPSGRWRLRPISPVEITSEPEQVELTLEVGALERIDWTISPSTGPDTLTVRVSGPDGESVAGAVVEIRGRDAPAGPWHSGRYGAARIFGLEPGERYRVLAGHADFLEAETEIVYDPERRFDPQSERGSIAYLRLEQGAAFELEAIDPGEAPLRNVELTIERVDVERMDTMEHEDDGGRQTIFEAPSDADVEASGLPPIALEDPAYRAAKLRRAVLSDRRGRARAGGFYGGRYLLSARLHGSEEVLGKVLLSARSVEPAFEIAVELPADSTVRVDAEMVPAARLSTTLQCDDGGGLPPAADVRIFRAIERRGGILVAVSDQQPAVDIERRPLEGPNRNRLVAGPLDPGVFEVAIRPQGFDRWTWAYETTDRSAALPLEVRRGDVREGRELDLGVYVVECEPAVELILSTQGDVVPRWLAQAKLGIELLERELDVATPPKLPTPRYLLADNVLSLQRLATGRTRLRLELRHPFLMPEGLRPYDLDLELERGGFARREIELRGIGGAIVVAGLAEGAIAQAWRQGEKVRQSVAVAGRAELAPLVPGAYEVKACSDARCERALATWSAVTVAAGSASSLPLGSRPE